MAHKYILDTHALIWFAEGNKRLSESAKAILAATNSQMVLPMLSGYRIMTIEKSTESQNGLLRRTFYSRFVGIMRLLDAIAK